MRSRLGVVRGVVIAAVVAVGLAGAVVPAQAVDAQAPGMPLRVVASDPTGNSLVVTWVAPPSDGGAAITDYTIQSRKIGEVSWSTFTHSASTATSATVTGLSAVSKYVFRVAAVNNIGTGPWSRQDSAIDAGSAHSCVVMAGGTVTCWGNNGYGRLGDYTETPRSAPVSVWGINGLAPESTAVSVSAGDEHSCALLENGTVTCWGNNVYGQLGHPVDTDTKSLFPVAVSEITGASASSTAIAVSAGGGHSCAVMATGAVKCWGLNTYGQLGDGTTNASSVPIAVSGITGADAASTALSVSAGGDHTCALMANGAAKCWGYNGEGELGNDSTTDSAIPVQVNGIGGADASSTAVSVSAGPIHACATLGRLEHRQPRARPSDWHHGLDA